MANTRTVLSPGVFANDALTVIPPSPVQGTAYRNPALSVDDVEQGWPYGVAVASDVFNQILFQISTLVGIMDQQGMLGWSNLKNYTVGDHVLSSTKVMYRCILANGPAGAGAQDPLTASTYWAPLFQTANNAETIAGVDTTKGVSPAALSNFFNGTGRTSRGLAGYQRIGGLLIQWLNVTIPGPTAASFTWPIAFSTLYAAFPGSNSNTASPAYLTSLTVTGGAADFANGADGGPCFIFAIGI